MNKRITKHQWAMDIALISSERSTCCRRKVGCVLLNERGHVLSTGYNGVAAGLPHCNEVIKLGSGEDVFINKCQGADSQSGTNLDGCQAIHAEQNALLQCSDVYKIHTCYVTTSPCITCVKLLLNTSCKEIAFIEEYPQKEAEKLWISAGRNWSRRYKFDLGVPVVTMD